MRTFIHNSYSLAETLVIDRSVGEYGGIFAAEGGSAATGGPEQFVFHVADADICDDEMLLDVRFDNALIEMHPELSQSERDSVIRGTCTPDHDHDWEVVHMRSMWLQKIRGDLAVHFGYKAVSMIDETGVSFLILDGIGERSHCP